MKPFAAPFRLARASDQRTDYVKRWWRARQAVLKTRQSDDDGDDRTGQCLRTEPAQHSLPFDVDVNKGDVRLLSPFALPNGSRMLVYVAVLTLYPQDGLCLVAPFSPYGSPATCGEWLTGYAGWPVRTLQLWNARTAPTALIAQSWRCFRMNVADRKKALLVLQSITSGMVLPDDVREYVGLPILKEGDPRIAYQNEERELLQPLTEAAADLAFRTAMLPQSVKEWLDETEYEMEFAADSGDRRRVTGPVMLVDQEGRGRPYELDAERIACVFDPEEGWEVRWIWPQGPQYKKAKDTLRIMPGMPVSVFLKPDGKTWKECVHCTTEGAGRDIVCRGGPADIEVWKLLSGSNAYIKFVIQSVF